MSGNGYTTSRTTIATGVEPRILHMALFDLMPKEVRLEAHEDDEVFNKYWYGLLGPEAVHRIAEMRTADEVQEYTLRYLEGKTKDDHVESAKDAGSKILDKLRRK